ncbi:MAG TPA: DNA-binding protein WhiA [Syntrophomonadaceae bacterium]|nr:DNA-binding protein WhiA [Syntrophomonadaceae bacterium]
MSFSNDVRNEIARIIPDKACCRKAELSALLLFSGQPVEDNSEDWVVHVAVENAVTARKIYQLLKETYGWTATVDSEQRRRFKKTRSYEVTSRLPPQAALQLEELGLIPEGQRSHLKRSLLTKTCCKRAFIRGLFLSRGFIGRPEGNYHLELVVNDSRLSAEVRKLLHKLDLEARVIERKSHLVIYLKESEKIVDFLRMVGASRALLNFENVRILKSMRNSVNRQVNCETANLAKTIDASVRQVELMERLIKARGWDQLAPQLKELALLRLEYRDSTLKELGEMLSPPLSKSGAAYRMRRLEQIAERLLDHS